jgi:hypothetical protein
MRRRLLARTALLATLCCAVARSYAAEPSAAVLARQSLEECERGRLAAHRSDSERHFTRGLELAERAVDLDERSADAHFAVFCNQGEMMRLDGESIRDVLAFRALQRELDRTLELKPDHADALSVKGTFLVRLPRVLGGDVARGEAMLQRVLTLDPDAVSARLSLARVCEWRGRRDEGVAYARRALQAARARGRADKVAEAQAMLAELGASH